MPSWIRNLVADISHPAGQFECTSVWMLTQVQPDVDSRETEKKGEERESSCWFQVIRMM